VVLQLQSEHLIQEGGGGVATSFTEARVQRDINFCCGELLWFADVTMFSICFLFPSFSQTLTGM